MSVIPFHFHCILYISMDKVISFYNYSCLPILSRNVFLLSLLQKSFTKSCFVLSQLLSASNMYYSRPSLTRYIVGRHVWWVLALSYKCITHVHVVIVCAVPHSLVFISNTSRQKMTIVIIVKRHFFFKTECIYPLFYSP